ncbi:MAG: hypothetical protein J5726_01005 [Treponema sp.]|nr:hypothetical protein [Treponema sp.]
MKKSFARFFIALFITAFVCQSLCAASSASSEVKVPRKYRLAAYTKAVEKELGHKSEKYELSIINTAYSYYSSQCENKWDKQTWKDAVAKGVELCRNKIAIAAAKAGEFGEKVLKALVTATKDAAESISNWLDKKSEEYDNYMKEKDSEKQDYSMTQI